MVVEDIGYMIFVQLLQMTEYPGSPFTGEIARDVVMFLLVPSVFILLLIYMILGRLFSMEAGTQRKLRVLVGITIYLFIIAGGYYRAFALLAGPYFLFLIFILGLFYFIFGHFGVQRGAGPYREGGAYQGERPNTGRIRQFLGIPSLSPMERSELEHELEVINDTLAWMNRIAAGGGKLETNELNRLMRLKANIEVKLYGRKKR